MEEVSSDTDVELTLLPAEDFADEDWRTPDEFEKIVKEMCIRDRGNRTWNKKSDRSMSGTGHII